MSGPPRPILLQSPGEVAVMARKRRTTVLKAIQSGALPVLSDNPAAKGRTPRWLIDHMAALRWIAAGCPTMPPAAGGAK